MVENACLALSRIADALAGRPQHLDMLCSAGLIANATQLVAVSEAGSMTSQLSVSTYYGLIRLLTTCARGSPAVAESLLQADMSGTMRSLLARQGAALLAVHAFNDCLSCSLGDPSAQVQSCLGQGPATSSPPHVLWWMCSGHCTSQNHVRSHGLDAGARPRSSTLFSGAGASAGSVLRSSDQLADVVSLALELLPPLPEPQPMVLEALPLGAPDLTDTDGARAPTYSAAMTLNGIFGSGKRANKVAAPLPCHHQERDAHNPDGFCLAAGAPGASADEVARRRFICDNLDLLQSFSADLLPLMLQVHGGTVMAQARGPLPRASQRPPPLLLTGIQ